MNVYEEHPFWVKKTDPTCFVRVCEIHDTTLMWNPRTGTRLVVQHLGKPGYETESFLEKVFLREFEGFSPPRPQVDVTRQPWWRSKTCPANFVQVRVIFPWQGPNHPVRVGFGLPGNSEQVLDESQFLEEFEPSGPPPSTDNAWGKVWADD